MTNLDSLLKSRDIIFVNKGLSGQGYDFSSGHVWMWELDCEESWVPKYWCFWTVVLEKTLESPLDCKEIQPVHPKADQSCVFIGRTDAEAETPVLWPPDAKSWLIWKGPDAGRDWGQEEKGMTEDEMAGWHHWLYGHGFGWTPGVGDGQGGLVCCGSWGHKELDTSEWLNWTDWMLVLQTRSYFLQFFFFLTLLGSECFHVNLRVSLSNSTRKSSEFSLWFHWTYRSVWGNWHLNIAVFWPLAMVRISIYLVLP